MKSPINNDQPWATIMMVILVGIAAIAGGAVVVFHGETLSFEQYLDLLKNFAIAVGILGIGRGIVAHGKNIADASMVNAASQASPGVVPTMLDGDASALLGADEIFATTGEVPETGY
jgi:hypothetical protein